MRFFSNHNVFSCILVAYLLSITIGDVRGNEKENTSRTTRGFGSATNDPCYNFQCENATDVCKVKEVCVRKQCEDVPNCEAAPTIRCGRLEERQRCGASCEAICRNQNPCMCAWCRYLSGANPENSTEYKNRLRGHPGGLYFYRILTLLDVILIDGDMNSTSMVFSKVSVSAYDKVPTYFYAVEGSFTVVFNIIMVTRLMLKRELREQKEYIVIAGCMIFDLIFGATYMGSGFWRLPLFYKYEYFPAYTRWECITTPHAILFTIITPTAGIFAFIISLDRLFCVLKPTKYSQLPTSYGYVVALSSYCLAAPFVLKAIFDSYPYDFDRKEPMTCNLSNALTPENYSMLRYIRVALSSFCVILYIPVFYKVFKVIQNQHKLAPAAQRNQNKLMKLTLTIGLITSNTLCLFTIPDIIMLLNPRTSSNLFYMMNLNKGVANIIIFLSTQKTLRNVLLGRETKSNIIPLTTVPMMSSRRMSTRMSVATIA